MQKSFKYDRSIYMKHKVKVTVIDKKLYPELQQKYCADPHSGACPCYNVGDEFIFEREQDKDDFWHMGINTLVKTNADPNTITRRFNYEGLDERRKHYDYMLFRWNSSSNF